MERRRRPWVAALISLLQPGLGHLYAGAPDRAVAAALSMVMCIPIYHLSVLLTCLPGVVLLSAAALLGLTVWIAVDAARAARRQPGAYALQPYNRWSVYIVWIVAVATLTGGVRELTHRHLSQAFHVPSESMQPSLRRGDLIYARTLRPQSHLHHGSIVIFSSVEEPGLKNIKRVVGMTGDTVAMRRGILYRNSRAVAERYAVHDDSTRQEDPVQRAKMRDWQMGHLLTKGRGSSYAPDLQDWGPLLVPPDSLLLLGDNRDFSYDSRYYGFVPVDHILGRPIFIYYSYDPWSRREWPRLFAPRWERIGTQIAD